MKKFDDIRSYIIAVTVQLEADIEECADLYKDSGMVYKMYSDTQDYLAGIFDMARFICDGENTLDDSKLERLEQFTYSQIRCIVEHVIKKYRCIL